MDCIREVKAGMMTHHYRFNSFVYSMTLTVIFKVIDIGYNTFSADLWEGLFEGHFRKILP